MSIVRNERIVKIAAASTSMVLGGGLTITGIALAPFTFGGSLALCVLGGVVGGLAAAGSISAFIAAQILANQELKKAQQHINLDQQLSLSINEVANMYSNIMEHKKKHKPQHGASALKEVVGGVQGLATVGRAAGTATVIGVESTVEAGSLAIRSVGRFAGMALAGATLAVTVPIDISLIAYNSYHIHKARQDETGKTEKNKGVRWLHDEIEKLFRGIIKQSLSVIFNFYVGMCRGINEQQHEITRSQLPATLGDCDCGYKIQVEATREKNSTIIVRTIFSGPFILPEGYTLASAVYDITLPKLRQPAIIELEHCVSDQQQAEMCYATGRTDLEGKKLIFELEENFNESIEQTENCVLCILYKQPL